MAGFRSSVRRRWAAVGMTAVALLSTACGAESTSAASVLNWFIFNPGATIFTDAAAECSAASGGEYSVQLQYLPSSADGQRQQMVRRLAASDSSLDILGLDVTWAPEFAEAGWITPWPEQAANQVKQGTFQTSVDTGTWKGQLVAAPYNANTELLWYRKDLVPTPPKTWSEMLQMSQQLKAQGKPYLIESQGKQGETLTVWFNTMVTSAGGKILTSDSSAADLGQPAETALATMKQYATSGLADPSMANQGEDDNRLNFEQGNAAFELNYPFIYPSAKKNAPDLFKNLGYTTYPQVVSGQPSHVTIGGIDLAVSAYSKHQQAAFDAITCLRQPKYQVINAVKGGLPPVATDTYQNPTADFVAQYPFYKEIFSALQGASVRPQTPAYQSLSILLASTLHPASDISPQQTIATLRGGISDALNSKGLIP